MSVRCTKAEHRIRMNGLIFRRTTRIFLKQSQVSKIAIRFAFPESIAQTYFHSTLTSAAMSSTKQSAAPNRAVGKKFVIACDGSS